jgi:hypothetical protein
MKALVRLSLVALTVAAAQAAPPVAPLPDHPLIGTWRFTLPQGNCVETYIFRPDGTTVVVSGEEIGESAYEIANEPSSKGFYKWTDVLTRDNGGRDCSGDVMKLGHESTNFILVHPSRDKLLVCRDESLDACFGPLQRVHGQEI